MPFPTTPVLETFGDTLVNWKNPETSSGLSWTITAGQLKWDEVDANISGYYLPSTFGPNSEVFVTIPTLPDSGNVQLRIRLTDVGAGLYDGYMLFVDFNLSEFSIYRFDNGSSSILGSAVSQTLSAGDKIGVGIIGSIITGYRFTGGAWSEILSRTDATYSDQGFLGLRIPLRIEGRYDDFGGGTVPVFDDGTKTKVFIRGPMATSYFQAG